jgi:hypothetical protein
MLRLDASGSLVLETASTESSSGFGSEERGSLAGNVPDRVSSRALSRIRRSPSWLCECVIVVFRRARPTPALGIYSVHRDLGIRIYRGSMSTIVAVHGQYRPPPKLVPCRSTSDGRPSQSSIVLSANATSSRCQLQPVLACVPGAIRPMGIRAVPPACAARAAAMTSPFVNEARKSSSITEKVTMAWGDGPDGEPSHPAHIVVKATKVTRVARLIRDLP